MSRKIRIAINGFGRIGRTITRLLVSGHAGCELVAVNTLEPPSTSAFLFNHDSTYGPPPRRLQADSNHLIIGERKIPILCQSHPSALAWGQMDIDVLIDCSGMPAAKSARLHHESGAPKVIVTAAERNVDATLCYGVNHEQYNRELHHVVSSASCTTNCVAPALKVISRIASIDRAMVSFYHSYTRGQCLLDNGHQDLRRARSALGSIIPTSTSATWQVPLVLPFLKDRFDGLAVRVPSEVVHLADLTILLQENIDLTLIKERFKEAAEDEFAGIMLMSEAPLVSRDVKKSIYSCIVDGPTINVKDNLLKILIWHDNEYAYSCRVLDLAAHLAA